MCKENPTEKKKAGIKMYKENPVKKKVGKNL